MGVPGLWEAISSARELQCIFPAFEMSVRPSRVAVDISIWLFQCAAATGGDDPILRTFFYRLCRLVRTHTRAIFVFDGPKRPGLKRGKRVRGRNHAFYHYKLLIQHFGYLIWEAPGEAEAEAARLQSIGVVDAVLSDDVDTFLFGATKVYKNWAALDQDGKKAKKNLSYTWCYTADNISRKTHLDTDAMILMALLAGGDYFPSGLSSCGIKTALEIVRAGHGTSLREARNNLQTWREKLQESLRTNAQGHFSTRHPKIKIPESFPDLKVYDYYSNPVVTDHETMIQTSESLDWAGTMKIHLIKEFCSQHLGWNDHAGCVNVVRNLSPPVLATHLSVRSQSQHVSEQDPQIELRVHGTRLSPHHNGHSELRISYIPIEIVPIDIQESSDEYSANQSYTSLTQPQTQDHEDLASSEIVRKIRTSTTIDCHARTRIWLSESLMKSAYPQLVNAWYAARSQPIVRKSKDRLHNSRDGVTLETFGFLSTKTTSGTRTRQHSHVKKSLLDLDQIQDLDVSQNEHQVMLKNRRDSIIDLTEASFQDDDQPIVLSADVPSEQDSGVKTTVVSDESVSSRTRQSTTTTQSSIKAFFATTKVVSNSMNKASTKSKPQDAATKIVMSEPSEVRTRRKIVIRQSLPGAWKKACDEDENQFEMDKTIDLT